MGSKTPICWSRMTRGSSLEARPRAPVGAVIGSSLLRSPSPSGPRPADRRGRRRVARCVGLLHVADTGAGGAGGVVGQVEVLAEREALVIGRHVDPAKVAIALEDDAEHVVGLALHPFGALPQGGHG